MAEVDTKSEIIESKVNELGDESKENEDGDESKENEDGDESLKSPKSKRTPLKSIPLLDSPLTQSGKRVRAQAPQFVIEKKEEFVYEFNGSGVALGDIPFIEHMINKEMADNLKKLHSVCFGRTGDRSNVKKNLRQFNGFNYDKSDKKYEAKKTNMDRFFKADLGLMCNILGLEKSGTKTDVQVRVLDFVLKPEDNQKNIPQKKKKKSGNKKKRSDKGKKKERKSKGGDTESDSAVNDENDSTANDTADSSDSGSESEPEEKPKKTPAKKPAKTPAKKVATKTPAKKTPAKKTPAKKTPAKKSPAKRSKEEVDSDSDSSDDEPLIKKTKSAPSNDEITKKVKEILEGADLEEVTMKSVCKQIYDMYPGFDLTDRKSLIKETVKAALG